MRMINKLGFFSLPPLQTGSEAHLEQYPVCSGGSVPRVKASTYECMEICLPSYYIHRKMTVLTT